MCVCVSLENKKKDHKNKDHPLFNINLVISFYHPWERKPIIFYQNVKRRDFYLKKNNRNNNNIFKMKCQKCVL